VDVSLLAACGVFVFAFAWLVAWPYVLLVLAVAGAFMLIMDPLKVVVLRRLDLA